MREIKFRAWDKWKKIMLNVDEIHWNTGIITTIYDNNVFSQSADINDKVLMQFTGLKDKNGKEVYEGDILQIPDDYDTWGFHAGDKREVVFAYGGFRLKAIYDKKARGNYLEDDGEFEIIGNIYENPECVINEEKSE